MATFHRLNDYRRKAKAVFFSRTELNQLLSLYSRQVMRGEWRDYAIDQRESAALFSVFRHTQERPLYTVVKFAPGTSRHGDFAVLSGPQRVASGPTIADVLRTLQKCLPAMRPVEIESYRR
ncbi:MAG TPA: DUF2794 domain-containing protein [Stellaceae bacterium]|nr:DUF2794 domain-containing protein [Stellaceae bacterium]